LSVELADVCFTYADERAAAAEDESSRGQPSAAGGQDMVLDDVSFQLEPGQVLGVLGRTGSGKTTLTRLLFRLYDPACGSVRLNDVDIRDVALDALRERVGMVTQDVQLFQATVRDNLTFFNGASAMNKSRACSRSCACGIGSTLCRMG